MDNNEIKTESAESEAPTGASVEAAKGKPLHKKKMTFVGTRRSRGGRRGKGRPGRETAPELDQSIIGIRRVARVMAGGRRFSFSVAIVVGNRKGKVGVGLGKAADTSLAIEKAFRDGKKRAIQVPLTETNSISREVSAKHASAKVFIKPAPGRGLVAGSSVRSVLELAGISDVSAKILSRSKNKLNNARAAIKALKKLT